MTVVTILRLGGVVLSFFASVMFSGASSALGQISRDSIQKLMENKVRGASLLYTIIRNKRRFQLMLLSGRILAVVCGSMFIGSFAASREGLVFSEEIAVWIAAFVLSGVAFVFAEAVVGRLISIGEYEETVPRFTYFLAVFHLFLFPLTLFLETVLSLSIEKNQEIAAKEEALIELVKSESEAGVLEQEEKNMIEGVLDFFDTTVREVMVPRIDMVAVEKDTSIDELVTLFKEKGHSRIPVYDERIDNIMGVVYAKDILPVIAERGKENLSITGVMRKPYFVHESKKISDLLAEFRKAKVHLAIVVDEYGGTAGIVALEDLLEEIVGDIRDEFDRDERDYFWINDRMVLLDAGLPIDEVNEIIHSDIQGEDFDTLAGFIYHKLGLIPKGGEEFRMDDYTFIIKQIKGNRISKVLVKLDEPLMKDIDTAE